MVHPLESIPLPKRRKVFVPLLVLTLWVILANGPSVPWPRLAWSCATIKFTLVALGLLYALLSALWVIFERKAKRL